MRKTLTLHNPIGGTSSNLVADGTSSLLIGGTAPGIGLPASVAALADLSITNPYGLSLTGDLTVMGTLELVSGNLDAGSRSVTIGPSGALTRTSGHVVGALRKPVPMGAGISLAFEVGDAATYAPVSISADLVSAPGWFVVRTTPGDHPGLGASGLEPTRSVNRWWSVANEGVAFDRLAITFQFAASDVDPGTRTNLLSVAQLDATWSTAAVASRSPASTTIDSVTSLSDFAIGEVHVPPPAEPTPGPGLLPDTARAAPADGRASVLVLSGLLSLGLLASAVGGCRRSRA